MDGGRQVGVMYLVCSKALDTVAVLTSNMGHDGLDGQITGWVNTGWVMGLRAVNGLHQPGAC